MQVLGFKERQPEKAQKYGQASLVWGFCLLDKLGARGAQMSEIRLFLLVPAEQEWKAMFMC